MPVIVVANPKGGVGKSTLSPPTSRATSPAQGHAVMLGDVDRQQSSRTWLGLRPAGLPPISGWDIAHDEIVRPPKGTTHVVLDTPAGLHGKRLDEVMKLADKVIVPLQPASSTSTRRTTSCASCSRTGAATRCRSASSACASREGTISADQLRSFLDTLEVPLLGFLRDTQNYVHLAARGLTLWDVAPEPGRARPGAMADRSDPSWQLRARSSTARTLRTEYTGCMRTFEHLADLAPLVGQDVGASDWITVDQQRIDLFADATGDHQWIHVDPERAAAGPFGTTIAHGFLTLSLLPEMSAVAFAVGDTRMGVNYGLNKVRFPRRCRWAAGCAGTSSCSPTSRSRAARR